MILQLGYGFQKITHGRLGTMYTKDSLPHLPHPPSATEARNALGLKRVCYGISRDKPSRRFYTRLRKLS